MRRAAIKQKRELVLFYFYFSFIAVVLAALGIDREIECYKTVNLFRVLCLLFFCCYDVNSVNKNQSKYYKTILAVDFLNYNTVE